MIITRQWIQEFITISHISTENICKTLNSIGLEVDSVTSIKIPDGVVLGKVLKKEKHPDADKLNVCQVDIGTEVSQIVCGAKNVEAGQYVPVATVGCKLGEDFKIKKAKLRGVESNGMICSSTEIGLPKLNDGILELDDSIGELIIGKPLNEYEFFNDDIIEIELTANRGDCLSIHGIARELSTAYRIPMNVFEEETEILPVAIGQILEINTQSDIEANIHFKAANIEELKLPVSTLIRSGYIEAYKKTQIETAIAYVMHTTGVLLNVYSKIIANQHKSKVSLHIKKDEEGFDCIHGGIKLSTIGIDAGEIEKEDNDVILEASYINPEFLSQKVFDTKKKTTEIYYRSSRGSEPNIDFGMKYLATFLSKCGGKIYQGSETITNELPIETIDINLSRVNAIIGQEIEKKTVDSILALLGFSVKDSGVNSINVTIPAFRHDIKNIADITEEIVRIIGIDNIKAKPLQIDEVNRINGTTYDLIKKNKFRRNAIQNGFYETVTYVFTSRENLLKYNFDTVVESKDILNPIISELNTYRTSLLPNLVEAASNNFKSGYKSVALFEIGTIFSSQRDESTKMGFVFSGEKESPSIQNNGKPSNLDLFGFANKIANTIGKFELEPMQSCTNDFIHPYQSANILIDGQVKGYIAKLHPNVCNDYDLPDTFVAQIDFDAIEDKFIKATATSKYQASRRDLSFVAPKSLEYKAIKNIIKSLEIPEIKQFNLIDIYSDEKLGENESLTIRFVLQSNNKTLEEEDITTIMDTILKNINEKLGIGLR